MIFATADIEHARAVRDTIVLSDSNENVVAVGPILDLYTLMFESAAEHMRQVDPQIQIVI